MIIETDDKSGFCFGVVRAITEAERALADAAAPSPTVYSLGDVVHNRMEVQRLGRLGLRTVTHADIASLAAGDRLLIRAHGEPPSTYEAARRHGVQIIDATCPVVAALQRKVKQAHEQMARCGGSVVIMGKHGHAEVVGLTGQVAAPTIVVESEAELDAVPFDRPVYFLSQTTQSIELFGRMCDIMRRRLPSPDMLTADDTICRQVSSREAHLREFAARYDTVLFVCGRKSSNGKVLYGICCGANPATHLIEEAGELRAEWFAGVRSVGICGATSTPRWLMREVADAVAAMTADE